MSATVEAAFRPTGRFVDTTVTFKGFPRAGRTKYNKPNVTISKGDMIVLQDQPFFNGAVYQLDPHREPVESGDVLRVRAWWSAEEVRNGSAQSEMVVGTYVVG